MMPYAHLMTRSCLLLESETDILPIGFYYLLVIIFLIFLYWFINTNIYCKNYEDKIKSHVLGKGNSSFDVMQCQNIKSLT